MHSINAQNVTPQLQARCDSLSAKWESDADESVSADEYEHCCSEDFGTLQHWITSDASKDAPHDFAHRAKDYFDRLWMNHEKVDEEKWKKHGSMEKAVMWWAVEV